MDAGDMLRTARERRHLSLDALAETTRVSRRVLQAIEDNDVAALPAPVFVRGFLRSYAREVGLDPDAVVNAFMTHVAAAPAAGGQSGRSDDRRSESGPPSGMFVYRPSGATGSGAFAALALAAIALAIVGYLSTQGATLQTPNPPAPVPVAEAAAPAPEPAASEAAPIGTSGRAATIEIHPTGPCWVDARGGGESRIYRLMQAGDRETVSIGDGLALRVGDPTAFAYSIDGRPGRPLGATSQPVSVHITPDTVRDFLE
jgi:cytoskeletal protein RodZ